MKSVKDFIKNLLFGLIFLGVGVMVICLSISKSNDYKEKSAIFIDATGIVVSHSYNIDDGYAEIIEYTVDDEVYRKTSNVRTDKMPTKGSQVKIKYNPDNPDDIIWVDENENGMVIIFGIIFVLAGAYVEVLNVLSMFRNR